MFNVVRSRLHASFWSSLWENWTAER